MGLDQFMLFRFRNIEGVLDGVKSWNIDTCVFKSGTTLKYDLKNETVTIIKPTGDISVIKISECTMDNLIKNYGLKERFENRHVLSFKQETPAE